MHLAIASAITGGGMQAAGHLMAAREKSAAQKFESQEQSRIAQENQIAASQTEARRRENLTSSLETIMAIRAGRGVGQASPTGMASIDEIVQDEERDVRTERLNYLTRSEQARMASKMLKRQSRMTMISGYLQAGSDAASTGYQVGTVRRGA